MLYSRRTVVEALKLLTEKNHSDINLLSFTHDLMQHTTGDNRTERVISLTNHLWHDRVEKEDTLNEIVEELIGDKLARLKYDYETSYDFDKAEEDFVANKYPALVRSLLVDGFSIRDFKLIRQVPEAIKLAGQPDELFMLLEKHNFIARTNLEQAINNHARGQWESSNGQIRTFMESIFNEMAEKIHGDLVAGHTPTNKRDWLEKTQPPLLDPALGEIQNDGKNFINGIMKRLHPKGAHPGLSDQEDSTFRLHFVVVTSLHYLRRFHSHVKTSIKNE